MVADVPGRARARGLLDAPPAASSSRVAVPGPGPCRYPLRRSLVVGEAVLAAAGLAGSVALVLGRGTPPITALAPLRLRSWVLPGLWLAATVPVPAATAAVLAARRAPQAPTAAVVAATTLGVELVVQIPFIGRHPLQAAFGTVAAVLAGLGVASRRLGWPTRPSQDAPAAGRPSRHAPR